MTFGKAIMKKKIRPVNAIICITSLSFVLCSCTGTQSVTSTDLNSGTVVVTDISAAADKSDEYFDYTKTEYPTIELNGDTASSDGAVKISDGCILIQKGGVYVLRGEYNGTVLINTTNDDKVCLVLEGATITGTDGPAVYEEYADKTIIMLPEGTVNRLTDSAVYSSLYDSEASGTIFCDDDLTINGSGSLTVTGYHNDGIVSKEKLNIMGGEITVSSVDDGIISKESLYIAGGAVNITASDDGIKVVNGSDTSKNNIVIDGGLLNINAGSDGIQADNSVKINGGDIIIATGSGAGELDLKNAGPESLNRGGTSSYDSDDDGSIKGIKAEKDIIINSGTISIDAEDDAVHSNMSILISGGAITLKSGDDAIHADATITVEGGKIDIPISYEGLESPVITINDGELNVTASDDAINITNADGEGNDSETGVKNPFTAVSENSLLTVNGGTVTLDSYGDGIDSNGNILMNGGYLYVSGSVNDGNNATDYAGEFTVNGGTIVSSGMSGMYQSISADSKVAVIDYFPASVISAGTVVSLYDGSTLIDEFTVLKQANAIMIASDKITSGSTYTLSSGGETVEVTAGEPTDSAFGPGGFGGPGRSGGSQDFGNRRPEDFDENSGFGGPGAEGGFGGQGGPGGESGFGGPRDFGNRSENGRPEDFGGQGGSGGEAGN